MLPLVLVTMSVGASTWLAASAARCARVLWYAGAQGWGLFAGIALFALGSGADQFGVMLYRLGDLGVLPSSWAHASLYSAGAVLVRKGLMVAGALVTITAIGGVVRGYSAQVMAVRLMVKVSAAILLYLAIWLMPS